jgi:hypothetical protein
MLDSLLKYRNDSGDSYREMSSALYGHYGNKKQFPLFISKVAKRIKEVCRVDDWQKATEEQLKKRDKIHGAIKLYSNVLTNCNQIVRLSILEADPTFYSNKSDIEA